MDLLKTSQAAELIGVTTRQVRNLAAAGQLPFATTAGGHRRFRREDVERLIQERKNSPVTDGITLRGNR